MNVQLVLIEGGKKVVVRPRLPTVIGRNTQSDVQVPDSLVSRRHCELYDYQGQLAVRDLGSVNGTLVNQMKIEQDTFLITGDKLTIGKVTFRIEVDPVHPDIHPPTDEAAKEPAGGAAAQSPAAAADVVVVDADEPDSTVHSESAVLNYQSSSEGSFLGISPASADDAEPSDSAAEKDENDDEGLDDFLRSLGG